MSQDSVTDVDLDQALAAQKQYDNNIESPPKDEEEQPPVVQQPVNTLVQTVGNRPFHISLHTVHNLQLFILTFPRGLTLLMSPSDPKRPTANGVAQLDVHRKFLPTFGKYLHWITFTFQGTGNNVKAQIMLPTRLEAACNLIQGGASACFINCPFRVPRRPQTNKRRILRAVRS